MSDEPIEGNFYWWWEHHDSQPRVAEWHDGEWWFCGTELGSSFMGREPGKIQRIPWPDEEP